VLSLLKARSIPHDVKPVMTRKQYYAAKARQAEREASAHGTRVTMPQASYLPEYTVAALNAAFCSPRCSSNRGRHCITDHRTNGDPDA